MASLKKRLLAVALTGAAAVSLIAPASLADDYSYVNAEHLNVRSVGSVRGKIVATVDKGYRMSVIETLGNGWKKVLLENGQEGFVNGKYLVDETPYYEKVTATRYAVKVAHAFVRSDGLLKKIAVVDAGDQLEAVSDRVYFGRWIRVRVAESANPGYVGRVGYISKRLVEAVEGSAFETADAVMENSSDESQDASMDSSMDSSTEEDTGSEDVSTEEVPEELNSAPAETSASGSDESSDEDLAKLLEGL